MLTVFFVITLLFVPVFYKYYQGTAFSEESILARLTLGNLGHAEPVCRHHYVTSDKADELTCKSGKLS